MLGTSNLDSLEVTMISELVAALASTDGTLRQASRKKLVGIGRDAVLPLIVALQADRPHVCWEAAKALGQIGDPSAATALVESMTNPDEDVSWVAAESLVDLGNAALVPVLIGLLKHARFNRFRIGAHHVLNSLKLAEPNRLLDPVLAALDGPSPELSVPVAAETLLLEFVPPPLNSSGSKSLNAAK